MVEQTQVEEMTDDETVKILMSCQECGSEWENLPRVNDIKITLADGTERLIGGWRCSSNHEWVDMEEAVDIGLLTLAMIEEDEDA